MALSKLLHGAYAAAPLCLQNLAVSLKGWRNRRERFGPAFRQWRQFYLDSMHWPAEQVRRYQLEQILAALRYAREHVPYYRRLFAQREIDVEAVRSLEDFARLPLLEKADLRAAGEAMLSDEYGPRDRVVLSTSGSTGMPMRIYRGLDACKRSWAAAWAHNRPGVEPGDRCASFTGAEIVPPGQARPPYWRMNRPGNTRLYSVFHLGPAQLGNYAEDLLRFDPVWIYAYPSALSILAGYFLDRGLEPPPSLRTIVTSSEQLLPEFRERIEAAFGLAVTDEYGQGEMGAMGATCRRCGRMHLLGTYSHVEFLDAGRRSDRGAVREIVCTSFVNPCWPMIRYRVGDMAVLEEDNDCPLAQGGPSIREIHGRTAHVLWDREDRPIPFLSVKGCRNLRAVQAVQQTPGEVLLRVVPTEEYSRRADEPILLEKLRRRLGDESRMRVEVEYLAEIPRTASGKFLMIVSKVPPEKRPGG